jgi:hypothetical protein
MVFLDRTEHKTEVVAEKIAVGVPRGDQGGLEPAAQK